LKGWIGRYLEYSSLQHCILGYSASY
jgi:hypothetical protein